MPVFLRQNLLEDPRRFSEEKCLEITIFHRDDCLAADSVIFVY